jgi:hypothetical protein
MAPNLVPFDPKIVTLIQRCMYAIENDNNKPEIQYAAVMHYHAKSNLCRMEQLTVNKAQVSSLGS